MNRTLFLAIAVIIASALPASAFSIFGDSSNTNKPPKLHVLLQPANDLIEEAQMCELNGDPEAAVKNYQKAIEELDRVARENPDRAMTAEFAPLRNKAAVCTTQIDAIRLEQVNRNERRVAVTSSSKLQEKYNKKHGITNDVAKAESPAKKSVKEEDETPVADEPEKKPEPKKVAPKKSKAPIEDLIEDAKDAIVDNMYGVAASNLVAVLKRDPDHWDARFLLAYVNVARKDYAAAEVLFADMIEDRPNDVPTLLLYAAAQMGTKSYAAAQKTLETAIRANTGYYAGYYNMATLLLEMNSNVATARRYYEAGRKVGGPVDAKLEKRLGIRK